MNSRQYEKRKHHDNHKMRRQYKANYKNNNINIIRELKKTAKRNHENLENQPHRLVLRPEHVIMLQRILRPRHTSSKFPRAFFVFVLTILLIYLVISFAASEKNTDEITDELDMSDINNSNAKSCKTPPHVLFGQKVKQLKPEQIKECKEYGQQTAVKTCTISGKHHTLWAIKEKGFFNRNHIHTLDVKIYEYNRQLMKHIGIIQPDRDIYYEPKGYCESKFFSKGKKRYQAELYYGVETPNDFISYYQLQQNLNQKNDVVKLAAAIVREKIGESGIAKLAVASTFMHNIIEQNKAWGFSDKGLMVMSTDYVPNTIESYSMGPGGLEPGYYSHILSMPERFKQKQFYFSIETLKQMKNFYQHLSSMIPSPHIPADMFESIRQACENACQEAIGELQSSESKIDEPNLIVNDLLKQKLQYHLLPLIDAVTVGSPLRCH